MSAKSPHNVCLMSVFKRFWVCYIYNGQRNDTKFMNEHAANLFHVECRIPEQKKELLAYIRKFMEENDEKKLWQYREYITWAF